MSNNLTQQRLTKLFVELPRTAFVDAPMESAPSKYRTGIVEALANQIILLLTEEERMKLRFERESCVSVLTGTIFVITKSMPEGFEIPSVSQSLFRAVLVRFSKIFRNGKSRTGEYSPYEGSGRYQFVANHQKVELAFRFENTPSIQSLELKRPPVKKSAAKGKRSQTAKRGSTTLLELT